MLQVLGVWLFQEGLSTVEEEIRRKVATATSDSLSMVADHEVEDDLLIVLDGHRSGAEVWTLDSAHSHHYTPNRSWFATYIKTNEGSVILGDDHPFKVANIGTVWVQIFAEIVWTLTNVKHIPELKKNLVSLGYLERNGCSFSSHARSGVLNIFKGAMVVMRERRLENNLYRLEGSIVIKDFDIAVVAQDQHDLHRLWHYRLGHLGDRGMQELSRYGLIPDTEGGVSKVYEPCQMGKKKRV